MTRRLLLAAAFSCVAPGLSRASEPAAPAKSPEPAPPPAKAAPEAPKPETAAPPAAKDKPAVAPEPAPERMHLVVDTFTGFAIGGYDPVSYFLDLKARQGDPAFQYDWGGATWLFTSEGNMLAFRQRPDVYVPAFGGYCPYAISQGFPTEGHPAIFAIIDNRVHLFASPDNRDAYIAGGKAAVEAALARWPQVSRHLP